MLLTINYYILTVKNLVISGLLFQSSNGLCFNAFKLYRSAMIERTTFTTLRFRSSNASRYKLYNSSFVIDRILSNNIVTTSITLLLYYSIRKSESLLLLLCNTPFFTNSSILSLYVSNTNWIFCNSFSASSLLDTRFDKR